MLLNSRVTRCLFSWLLFAFLGSILAPVTRADDWLEVDALAPFEACGSPSRCCYHLTYGHAETGFNVSTLKLTGLNRSCWDVTCFLNQLVTVNGTPTTVTITWPVGGDPTLTFNPAIQAFTQVEFNLCPTAECSSSTYLGSTVGWEADDGGGGTPEANNNFTLNGCSTSSFDCLGCDRTIIYAVNDCYLNVCYKRRSTSGLSGPIKIDFDPPLEFMCDLACPDYPGNWMGMRMSTCITAGLPSGWSIDWSTFDGTHSYVNSFEIVNPTSSVAACEELCIAIPYCDPRKQYKITMSDATNPLDCSPSPIGFFKRGDGATEETVSRNNGESNYPNPVTRATDFKTMIPFTIHASAEARIVIMDETGRSVHTETQAFDGGGKHFFYFTGTQLPAGTYFYSIESPLGAIIVNRSLLIVK